MIGWHLAPDFALFVWYSVGCGWVGFWRYPLVCGLVCVFVVWSWCLGCGWGGF